MRGRQMVVGVALAWAAAWGGCGTNTEPDVPPSVVDIYPTWSPDGSTIAYIHAGTEIWTLTVATGEKRKVVDGNFPEWSPTGDRLSYAVAGRLVTRVVATGDTSSIAFPYSWPAHSPDWSRIAYVAGTNASGDVRNGIWEMTASGTVLGQALAASSAFMLAWSPRDSLIAFSSDVFDEQQVFFFSLRDSTVRSATGGADLNQNPTWSRDGSKLVFSRTFAGDTNPASGIYVINADLSDMHQVTTGGTKETIALTPGFSPDASQIVYSGYNDDANTYSLWVVNADGTDKHRLTGP